MSLFCLGLSDPIPFATFAEKYYAARPKRALGAKFKIVLLFMQKTPEGGAGTPAARVP
jgi:hypothetical protein